MKCLRSNNKIAETDLTMISLWRLISIPNFIDCITVILNEEEQSSYNYFKNKINILLRCINLKNLRHILRQNIRDNIYWICFSLGCWSCCKQNLQQSYHVLKKNRYYFLRVKHHMDIIKIFVKCQKFPMRGTRFCN